jgi:uncharacterized protein
VRSVRVRISFFAVALFFCLPAPASPDIKIPRSPVRWATDTAGFVSPQTLAELDSQLEAFERSTGHQVLLYIGRTTEGYPIEEFAVKAFEAWKVGRKGLDDGLVLFIMAEDKKIRIEVGYGLESIVPDVIASRVINDILAPGIRAGDNNRAVAEAVASLLQTISGQPVPSSVPRQSQYPERGPQGKSIVSTIFIVIAIIFFLILFITHPTLALWLLFNILSGGRGGGGGWGGGGGFGGGGGRSGGGGASGGW